jgi:uncharacterized protein (TIGR00299 family) protein
MTLHFDLFAGISGDMALGAFVDLGIDKDFLIAELGKLKLSGWELVFKSDKRCGITGTKATVVLHEHEHEHTHDHEHEHEHKHKHRESGHEHSHNKWSQIKSLIKKSDLSDGVKKRAIAIFTLIANAEAEVHGVHVENVAFHEVGALDSIIDIVGTAICLEEIAPDRITANAIELGGGTVKCAHGILPVPAPAVVKLTQGLPVRTGGFKKEMTTPTGAAIIAANVTEFITATSTVIVKKSGIGIGHRVFDKPNILRLSILEDNKADGESGNQNVYWQSEELTLIEANIDDMTGEAFGFLQQCLFEAGALDVTLIPCTMKKSRPGVIVSCLCPPEKLDALRRTMFERSTTIGFREIQVERKYLKRDKHTMEGLYGSVDVKTAFLADGQTRSKVEARDREVIANKLNINLDDAGKI